MNVAPLTKRALIEQGVDALDPIKYKDATVAHRPESSSVSYVNLPQVIEVAKLMAASQDAVPMHCRGNVGICLRLVFQSVEWQMSPFSVADMSYVVNNRLAYMSMLLHAVVEARAPLQHRLDAEYNGEGPTRTCTVRGMFITGDVREYTTPEFAKIRVKNSPLWKDDGDQQLFYYASRSWARKWCPDVLLGVYTKEELRAAPDLGREEEETAMGLHARLAGSAPSKEGHRDGYAARELAQLSGAAQTIEHEAGTAENSPADKATRDSTAKSGSGATKAAKRDKSHAKAKEAQPENNTADTAATLTDPAMPPFEDQIGRVADQAEIPPTAPSAPPLPKTVPAYLAYASEWIAACASAVELGQRWNEERAMRNNIGMTADDRAPLDEAMRQRMKELEK